MTRLKALAVARNLFGPRAFARVIVNGSPFNECSTYQMGYYWRLPFFRIASVRVSIDSPFADRAGQDDPEAWQKLIEKANARFCAAVA